VTFTNDAPVNLPAVTTKNFIVKNAATAAVVPGSMTPVQNPPNTVLWTAGQLLQPGDYQVTLVGDGSDAIASLKGKKLDGEPKQLPSGDGQEGGNFQFTVRVTAPLLKVRRVTITGRPAATATGGIDTVLFEAKEGPFNNSIQLPGGARPSAVEIEFTGGPVNKDSVKPKQTFVLRRTTVGTPVQVLEGSLTWPTDSVVRMSTAPLGPGRYSVALLAGIDPVTNQPVTAKVTATDGLGLDGEPSKLPSGNNAADGTFFFTMFVS